MTQIPAGWYPDPAPAPPGSPAMQRYWDGQQWTEHVQPVPPQTPPYGAWPPAQPYGQQLVPTTPDGQRLAGWWSRVGAYLIDSIVVLLISGVVGSPIVGRLVSAYRDLIREAVRASESGAPPPDQAEMIARIEGPLVAFVAVTLAVSFVYHVGFLKTLQATPGKLLLGLRVRLRERPGPLSWGTVLKRWFGQNVASFLGLVPVLGTVAGLYPLLDGLWPLWDAKKQAIHDKLAATNVVRTR